MSVSSISPHGPQHHAGTHPVTPQHHTGTHPVTPLQQQSCPPVNTIPQNHIQQQQGPTPLMPPPQSSQPLQSVSTIQQPSQLPVVAAATPSVPIPTPASVLQTSVASVTASLEKPEPCPASPTTQVQAQTSQPAERKSPRGIVVSCSWALPKLMYICFILKHFHLKVIMVISRKVIILSHNVTCKSCI